jgi:hypothetical protein
MSENSYLVQTRVKWDSPSKSEREVLWAWMRSEIGVHGEHWSCDIHTSEPLSSDSLIRIITLNLDDHVKVMCTWG